MIAILVLLSGIIYKTRSSNDLNIAMINRSISPTPMSTPIPTPTTTSSYQHTIKPNFITAQISWNVPAEKLLPQDEQELLKALKTKFTNEQQVSKNSSYTSIVDVTISGEWATLSEAAYDTDNNLIPTGGFEIYAHKLDSGWQIFAPGDTDFCSLIKQMDPNLIDYYIGCKNQ